MAASLLSRRDLLTGQRSVAESPEALPPLAVIALTRMGFGPRPGDWAAFQALGATDDARLTAYVDRQLSPQSIPDSACSARLDAAGLTTLNKTLTQLWADHFLPNPPWAERILPLTDTVRATMIRAVYSERQLFELLVNFWHDHFNIFGWDYYAGPLFVHYDRDIIRPNVLGNFRTLLEAVASSPPMLFYLNNRTNAVAGPNENYARELLELHTMGAENYLGVMRPDLVPRDGEGIPIGYVDADVYETTRCFTGWSVASGSSTPNDGTFYYRPDWHDRFQKWVLGRYIPADQAPLRDGRDVLDRLATHPGTARYIARKLCRRLVADDPPAGLVQAAATLFRQQAGAPDQLRQVVRLILLSNEFRTTWGQKVKRPFEMYASTMRASGANHTPSANFWWYNQAGQMLFGWRPPNGYPDSRAAWSGSMAMVGGWRIVNHIMRGTDGIAAQAAVVANSPASGSATQLADHWIGKVLGRPMAAAEREQVILFMADGKNPTTHLFQLSDTLTAERVMHMVGLICHSADFRMK